MCLCVCAWGREGGGGGGGGSLCICPPSDRQATSPLIMGQAVIKSWVKLLYNLDQIEAADHNQIVVISYSDSDCDPPLVQIEESHQV